MERRSEHENVTWMRTATPDEIAHHLVERLSDGIDAKGILEVLEAFRERTQEAMKIMAVFDIFFAHKDGKGLAIPAASVNAHTIPKMDPARGREIECNGQQELIRLYEEAVAQIKLKEVA